MQNHFARYKKTYQDPLELIKPLALKDSATLLNTIAENDNTDLLELHISDKKQRVRPKNLTRVLIGDPNGIRTHITTVKG